MSFINFGARTLRAGGFRSYIASGGIGFGTGAGGAVTQITSITTGVTLNNHCGTITTVAASAAAGAEHVFTVTNSRVAATDVPHAVIKSYAGTGVPTVHVTAVAAGSFTITITNLDAAAALNAALVLNFVVMKGVAA